MSTILGFQVRHDGMCYIRKIKEIQMVLGIVAVFFDRFDSYLVETWTWYRRITTCEKNIMT